MFQVIFFRVSLAITLLFSGLAYAADEAPLNPTFMYFAQGQTPDAWHWVLSDPSNWWQPIEANQGKSASGKLTLSSAASERFPGAVKLNWGRGDKWGSASISGLQVDLSAYEQAAELKIAIKVTSRVPSSVKVSMSCGEDCKADVDVANNLKSMPRGQWMVLPLALNCFAANGVDLAQVTSPFSIGSSGRLELHIAEVSLGAMAEGDQGCLASQ